MVLSLGGCGNTIKNEDEILQDLQIECDVFAKYGLEISSITITNRKTNSEGKSDVVYCSIVAENDDMKYTCNYIITYFLYDQGWLVENIDNNSMHFTPLSTSITLSQANDDAKRLLEQMSYEYQTNFSFYKEEFNLDECTHSFYFIDDTKTLQIISEYRFNSNWYLYGLWFEELE